MISVIFKRLDQVNCIDLIAITTKTAFTVYSAVGAGDAEGAAASSGKFFWENLREIWANLGKIWTKFEQFWAKAIKV